MIIHKMRNKRYKHFCKLAQGLDIIGERWTLLVIRELLIGPRRFKDFLAGLPGISTNTLSQRLKELERANLVQTRTLPPPAGSTVYELTPAGYALEVPILSLVAWSIRYLPLPPEDDAYLVGSIVLVLKTFFDDKAPAGFASRFLIGAEVLDVQVEDQQLLIGHENLKGLDMVVRTDAKTLMALLLRQASVDDVVLEQMLKIEVGQKEAVVKFLTCFPLRIPSIKIFR